MESWDPFDQLDVLWACRSVPEPDSTGTLPPAPASATRQILQPQNPTPSLAARLQALKRNAALPPSPARPPAAAPQQVTMGLMTCSADLREEAKINRAEVGVPDMSSCGGTAALQDVDLIGVLGPMSMDVRLSVERQLLCTESRMGGLVVDLG